MCFKIFLWLTTFLVVCNTESIVPPELLQCELTRKMIDASGKIPSGIMSGNLIDVGAYDQCLQIEAKYCLVKVSLPLDELMTKVTSLLQSKKQPTQNRMVLNSDPSDPKPGLILGWCIPKQCPIQNVTNMISMILNTAINGTSVAPLYQSGFCQTSDDTNKEISGAEWGIISFLIAISTIMLSSTLYDTYCYYMKQECAHILLIAFSIKTNGQKLLAISHNPDQLPCLNGIRFISMMWIIFGHRFVTSFIEAVINLEDLNIWSNTLANMYVVNAPVSVDTFFVLSGLLVGYVFLLAKDKGVNFNIILFYLHRYIRLTPALGVVIWIHATILERLGSGPFWPSVITYMKGSCVDYWWSSILYIQNYYNPDSICVGQTWYLSADTQLFFFAPIILIPLWRWPKYTMMGCVALVIGSMVSPFVVSYYYDIPAFAVTPNPDYNNKYYYMTHTRFGPWIMGLMLGFYIFRLKKDRRAPITLHSAQVVLGWIVSLALLFTTLYGGHNLLTDHNRIAIAFFNGMHRHAWSLGLCWVIYACTQGYGGPINSFLSWSVFQVLSRFTYTMYLIHLSLQFMIAAAARTNVYFTNFYNIHGFWADFAITLFLAVTLTLSFESPMLTIEKVLFKTGAKPTLSIHQKTTGQTNSGFQHAE